jgi:hypothetical protein
MAKVFWNLLECRQYQQQRNLLHNKDGYGRYALEIPYHMPFE